MTKTATTGVLDFETPHHPTGGTPPERRGIERDQVRLMTADASTGHIGELRFFQIEQKLHPGDLLVVNISATVPSSIPANAGDGEAIRVHFSSPITGQLWTVEPRRPDGVGTLPWLDFPGGRVGLVGGASLNFLVRDARSPRLWIVELEGIHAPNAYFKRHGEPIRYSHTAGEWPISDYQTVFATEPGSAEMPSAARPFSHRLVTSLVSMGVGIVPVVLHSGVASFEAGERPDTERFRVDGSTASAINRTRRDGGRVIAVGTTAVRAVETVADCQGTVHPGSGVTDLLITPERGVRAVDGIISGWHEPGASHLDLITAIGGVQTVARAYERAIADGYLWHEFGDSLLLTTR